MTQSYRIEFDAENNLFGFTVTSGGKEYTRIGFYNRTSAMAAAIYFEIPAN